MSDFPRINIDEVPKIEMDILCRSLISAMERFYADPENLKKFEEWKERKRQLQKTD